MKSCAVINDISGFGKCSLTAAIPILSSMGISVSPVVTGVFTSQTGFDSYAYSDLTDFLPKYTEEWKKLKVSFNAVLSGFLPNSRQAATVLDFLKEFVCDETLLVTDPAVADEGKLYGISNQKTVEGLLKICSASDVITPNHSELILLSGETDVKKGAQRLLEAGARAVVVTGVKSSEKISTFVFKKGSSERFDSELITLGGESSFSGTGDIFSAFITGKLLSCESLEQAVYEAVDFIGCCLKSTLAKNRNFGIDFEQLLKNI